MVKRISAFAAVLCCAFILCSCSVSRSQISAYVRGTLDSVYLNKNSAEYLKMIGGTAEECEAEYKQYIANEVEYFKSCMDIGKGLGRDLSAYGEDIRDALLQQQV